MRKNKLKKLLLTFFLFSFLMNTNSFLIKAEDVNGNNSEINIFKVDQQSGKPLKGAKFKIWAGKLVIDTPNVTSDMSSTDISNMFYETLYNQDNWTPDLSTEVIAITDKNGEISKQMNLNNSPVFFYQEIEAPDGYLIDNSLKMQPVVYLLNKLSTEMWWRMNVEGTLKYFTCQDALYEEEGVYGIPVTFNPGPIDQLFNPNSEKFYGLNGRDASYDSNDTSKKACVYRNFEVSSTYEDNIYIYTSNIEDLNVQNIDVEKKWLNVSDNKPEIKINLLANDDVIDTIILNEDLGWKYSWNDLPMFDKKGLKIKYILKEESIDNYIASYDVGDASCTTHIKEEPPDLPTYTRSYKPNNPNSHKVCQQKTTITNTYENPNVSESNTNEKVSKDKELPKTGNDSLTLVTISIFLIVTTSFGIAFQFRKN